MLAPLPAGGTLAPFSQENYAQYKAMPTARQAGERDRLARAGILIGLRGMGVEVGERLLRRVEDVRPERCPYKGVELLGFRGGLLANWSCRPASPSAGP